MQRHCKWPLACQCASRNYGWSVRITWRGPSTEPASQNISKRQLWVYSRRARVAVGRRCGGCTGRRSTALLSQHLPAHHGKAVQEPHRTPKSAPFVLADADVKPLRFFNVVFCTAEHCSGRSSSSWSAWPRVRPPGRLHPLGLRQEQLRIRLPAARCCLALATAAR